MKLGSFGCIMYTKNTQRVLHTQVDHLCSICYGIQVLNEAHSKL